MPLHLDGGGLVLGMTPSGGQECTMAAVHVSPHRKQKEQQGPGAGLTFKDPGRVVCFFQSGLISLRPYTALSSVLHTGDPYSN